MTVASHPGRNLGGAPTVEASGVDQLEEPRVFEAPPNRVKVSGLRLDGVPLVAQVTTHGPLGAIVYEISFVEPGDVTDEDETAAILGDPETMRLLNDARAEQAAGKLRPDSEVRKRP